jgi:NAD(P)-dependent dehydrogenase (short-subunit alcohol dehydrogenase family)
MSNQLFDLTGRVAIVTGASAGLGARFASVLHRAGASVVLVARRADRLAALRTQLPRSLAVVGDITDAETRQRVVETTLERYGSIDVLVNNAGVSGPASPAEHYSMERWDRTISVNLSALFQLTQLVAAPMLERRSGSVVNIASAFGLVAAAPVMDAGYAASKGALINLTRELAVEWARRGVRVNSIAPGWFPSEMTSDMTDDDRSQRFVRSGCPMGRMGEEHELDGPLLFLAGDASTYCTGQTIVIDGGWTAR